MIQFIRDYAKGVLAWIIIIIIIIPFALWGVNEYFQTDSTVTVAKVGERPISSQEYQRVYQREISQRRQASGRDLTAQDEATIRQYVLDGLISSEVMVQSALKAGFRVSDARVAQEIRTISQFQRDGKFDPELYAQLLRNIGMSQVQFEENVRRDLLSAQLAGGVSGTEIVTAHELDQWLRISEQQRKIGYYLVKADDYLGRVTVAEDEIDKYYRANLERFALPERVKAQYIELSLNDLMQKVRVDEADLRRLYDERAGSFTVGEERRARHILVKVDESAGDAAVTEAQSKADQLRERLAAGESFQSLARQYSDDTGSAKEGGDLGYFGRGVMVAPFEEAVFSLGKGEISEAIRSPFGFHIIEVQDIKSGSTRSFDEVRAQLEDEYRKAKAEEEAFDLTETLTNLTYEHPGTLQVAAEELGLAIHTTGVFSREQGDGVASSESFRAAAFGEDVIDGGNNSEPIQTEDGRLVVLRIAEKMPATHRALEEVAPQIRQELSREAARRLAEETGQAIRDRLARGTAVDRFAADSGAVWHAPVLMRRDDAGVPAEVLRAAFDLERPPQDRPATTGTLVGSADYAVIALYQVLDGRPEAATDSERRARQSEMLRRSSQQSLDDLLAALKERTRIAVYEDKL